MRPHCVIFSLMLGIQPAFAELIQHEVTPQNDPGWKITAERKDSVVTFTIYLFEETGTMPEGASAHLVVRDGANLVSSSSLALQSHDGKSCFRFHVAEQFLPDSQFRLSQMDPPHPSGDVYIVSLGEFAPPD